MGAPVQNRGNRRGVNSQRNNIFKGRGQGRAFNGRHAPFLVNPGIMRHRAPFRGNMRPPVINIRGGRGGRPPLRGRPIPCMPPQIMCPGPRGPPMGPIRPGLHFQNHPLSRMRHPPPPIMMGGPPLCPPIPAVFRGGPRGKIRFQNNYRGINKRSKIIRKNKFSMKNTDLTKSWVSEAIKSEFAKKDELLVAAKTSQSKEDWVKYREQREKCNKVYRSAEMEFIEQQEVCIPQLLPVTNFTRITAPIDYTADIHL